MVENAVFAENANAKEGPESQQVPYDQIQTKIITNKIMTSCAPINK